jgi:hypothetical protein
MKICIYIYTYTSIEIYQNYFYFKGDLLFLLILSKANTTKIGSVNSMLQTGIHYLHYIMLLMQKVRW